MSTSETKPRAGRASELEQLVESRTLELSALSTHLQRLSEKEKAELARTLHDELGGLLTAAKMDVSWLQSRLEMPAIQERLTQLATVLDEAMDLKRRVVEDLRPSLLDHFGLPTALRAHVNSVCAKFQLTARIEVAEDGGAVPKDRAIALFRIVQEALANVVRHANARNVHLQFDYTPEDCVLILADDGRGFDPLLTRETPAHGIMGMQQRVRAMNGRFSLESQPGHGTTVRVEIPKNAPADEDDP